MTGHAPIRVVVGQIDDVPRVRDGRQQIRRVVRVDGHAVLGVGDRRQVAYRVVGAAHRAPDVVRGLRDGLLAS